MPVSEEQYERMLAYQAAARALANEFRGRIDGESLADILRLIDENEAPIGLNHLAHAIEQRGGEAVTEPERQRLFDLVRGSEEVDYLAPSFARMRPTPNRSGSSEPDPAT